MNITIDPNLWVICALVFVLGLLIGVFLTAGGRRKWKARYNDEVDRRANARDAQHAEREKDWPNAREGMARARFCCAPPRSRTATRDGADDRPLSLAFDLREIRDAVHGVAEAHAAG